MSDYWEPVPLEDHHDLTDFVCDSREQTEWLRKHAGQAHASGQAKVFVVATATDPDPVLAYYAWCMSSLEASNAPTRMLKGAGQYPQPVALLARLGVHADHGGNDLGTGMLMDVFRRAAEAAGRIGCRGLLIHAESQSARDFYLHLVPEFMPSPTDPLHLVLMMKDLLASLRAVPAHKSGHPLSGQ